MTTQLIRYEAACHALAECKAIDEVKTWHDKAAAMQAYGRMAKDKTLEVDAAEIRIRAERRLGELIAQQKETVGLQAGARGIGKKVEFQEGTPLPTLADAGIDKKLSSRAQKMAAVPEAEFEKEVGDWRDRVKAEGARVTTRLEKAGKRALEQQPTEDLDPADELSEAREAISYLSDEVDRLKDQIAVGAMEGSEGDRNAAAEIIAGLRQEVATLEAENRAIKVGRDKYQQENAELKRQCQMQRRDIDKLRVA